jgi:glycosyltransferase involved in cell wall biosynthesis
MKKILFIADHRFDRSPGQRFRCEQYFDVLRNNGFTCELSFVFSEADDLIFYRPGNVLRKAWIVVKSFIVRWRDWQRRDEFDVVFIFRNCVLTGSLMFEKKWAKSGIPIVFDFDDAIWLNDTSQANQLFAWLKRPEKIEFTIGASAMVLAGNSFLRDYAMQFSQTVMVFPSTIDTHRYNQVPVKRNQDRVVIGWSGSITTIKHFESALPALLRIKDIYKNRVEFMVIGDPLYRNEALGIIGKSWNASTEPEDLAAFDIGIMPLPDDQWTKGKCGLKGLQYMAMAIPTVMSPVGVNSEIIDHGVNGYLAGNTDEWVQCLRELIEDEPLRIQMGAAAQSHVENHYSKNAWKSIYLKVFQDLSK